MSTPRAALLFALVCAGPFSARAQDTASLLAAVSRAPALEAARQRVEAARARIGAAGRLPDPELEAMRSRANARPLGDDVNTWELNLRQPLPKRGERAADLERARAGVAVAEADYALAAGELAADLALELSEAEAAQGRASLLGLQLMRLEAALKTLGTRLAAGGAARLGDRLTVQSRIASLQLAVENERRTAADALAAVRGRLGLPPEAPLPAFAAPAAAEISPEDTAMLAVARARGAEADAMGRLARTGAAPSTSVGLRYERERTTHMREDMLGVALSTELPFRSRGYARAEVRAAAADRAAAGAEAVAARYRVATALDRVARAERFADTARRLSVATHARLHAEHEALNRVVAVGSGMGDDSAVLHAVDILEKTVDTLLQIVDADASARAVRAELWRYLPPARLLAAPAREPDFQP
jgi:outer membrane protein TolC